MTPLPNTLTAAVCIVIIVTAAGGGVLASPIGTPLLSSEWLHGFDWSVIDHLDARGYRRLDLWRLKWLGEGQRKIR